MLLEIQTKPKHTKFYYFKGRDRLYGEIQASVLQEWGNFEVLKRCYILIYPAEFLLCYVIAIDLQHI